jgi:Leucine Rich repeat
MADAVSKRHHHRTTTTNNNNHNCQHMEMAQQQQQQQPLHRGVLNGIARLDDPRHRDERHRLCVAHGHELVDRPSLEHLFDVLDNAAVDESRVVAVTELKLHDLRLFTEPSDGGLNVLQRFFSRSDTTLTKVTLDMCTFGGHQDASQLFAAFRTNTTVTDLEIHVVFNLEGAVLGACLSGLLGTDMPLQLQRLDCIYSRLGAEGVRALQPALQENRTLRKLNLTCCRLEDDGIRIIADSLVGNTIMDVLDIGWNDITSGGLADITRILESIRLKTIRLTSNNRLFGHEVSTQRFTRVLSRHEFLKELCLSGCAFGDKGVRVIVDGLVGNTTMEALHIFHNSITSVGLADITRLIVSARLHVIDFSGNPDIFNETLSTQHFVSTLRNKESRVQELPGISEHYFPDEGSRGATFASINNYLTRNRQLNYASLVLAPPQSTPTPQQYRNNVGTHDAKDLAQGHCKVCQGPQQCWSQRHFQAIHSTSTTFGKASQTTSCC